MGNKNHNKFYLIREDVLPESVVKTLKVKNALKNNSDLSIDEKIIDRREFTLILYVNDIVGMLAKVLNTIPQL